MNPKIGMIIIPIFKGIYSPANPNNIPPTVNEPKDILDHQVKTLALYKSSTSIWIIVWVPIPTTVVLKPTIIKAKAIRYISEIQPIIELIINPKINIKTSFVSIFILLFFLKPIQIEADKAPNPAVAVIKDKLYLINIFQITMNKKTPRL